jgi:hypothetical protein
MLSVADLIPEVFAIFEGWGPLFRGGPFSKFLDPPLALVCGTFVKNLDMIWGVEQNEHSVKGKSQ